MNFSHALEYLKGGKQVRLRIWPKGTAVVLQKGYPAGIAVNTQTAEALQVQPRTIKKFPPYLMIAHPTGECVAYAPSQMELLSNLWELIGDGDDD